MDCISAIYQKLGMEMSPSLNEKFKAYISSPQKKSTSKSSLEEFGLQKEDVKKAFAGYIQQFNL